MEKCYFTKTNTVKLYKWYQIAQHITYMVTETVLRAIFFLDYHLLMASSEFLCQNQKQVLPQHCQCANSPNLVIKYVVLQYQLFLDNKSGLKVPLKISVLKKKKNGKKIHFLFIRTSKFCFKTAVLHSSFEISMNFF